MMSVRLLPCILLPVMIMKVDLCYGQSTRPRVFFNQLGYQTTDRKVITVAESTSPNCDVWDQKGRLFLTAELRELPTHPDYPMILRSCDLSALQEPGSYTIQIGDFKQPYPLLIHKKQPWTELLPASNRAFYFQRASTSLESIHAGPWARPAGHPDSSLRTIVEGEPEKRHDGSGGWYDAGDYGKYVVNAGISVATLLLQAERLPQSVGDQLNIPESRNGVSDLLDELRYELNWLIRMQDNDGGVFFKVGTNQWPGFILPHQDTNERLIIGKSTASTLNLAAVSAQASRIYASLDPDFAKQLLKAAEAAWQWARQHPAVSAPYYTSGGTGLYGDDQFRDEFIWAASQLAQVSPDPAYRNFLQLELRGSTLAAETKEADWWKNTLTMAYLGLSRVSDSNILDRNLQSHVRAELSAYARRIVKRSADQPFQIPYRGSDFIWGSNGGLGNVGLVLMEAYALEGDPQFLENAQAIVNYFLGHNIHGLSFVTGFGARSPQVPHHRPSGGDNVGAPVPGFLVGGPNIDRQDERDGVFYGPIKTGPFSYVDQEKSYASNEIAINWSAPFSYLLAAVQHYQEINPPRLQDFDLPNKRPKPHDRLDEVCSAAAWVAASDCP